MHTYTQVKLILWSKNGNFRKSHFLIGSCIFVSSPSIIFYNTINRKLRFRVVEQIVNLKMNLKMCVMLMGWI